MKFLKRNPWVGVVALILVAVLAVGGFAKLGSIAATPFAFTQGNLDADGKYVDVQNAIVTPNAIDCADLVIVPDFKFDGNYRVVFYDEKDQYIATSADMSNKRFEVKAEDIAEEGVYAGATQCRIVIIPKNDSKISDSEVLKYAAMLDISYAE